MLTLNLNSKNTLRLLALVLGITLGASSALAGGIYWSRTALLESFFATSKHVTYRQVELDRAQVKLLTKELGYAPAATQTIYIGLDAKEQVTGYAVIDNQRGQHEPITFGVLIDPQGRARRVEVMVYREAYGGAVREPRFREQFRDKTTRDPVREGQDIQAISGATISSKALAIGVKRALAVVTMVMIAPARQAAGAR